MITTGSDEKTMFEASGARSVQRSKIFSASSSDAEDTNDTRSVNSEIRLPASTTRDDLYDDVDTRIDYGFEYEFIEPPKEQLPSLAPASTPLEAAKLEKTDEDDQSYPPKQTEQTYEFLLFRKPANLSVTQPTPSIPNQIVIRSPTPEPILGSRGPGSILKPRSLSHYFTSHLPPSTLYRLQSEYAISALSPSQLRSLSSHPWPGTHLPWRAIYIPPSRLISQPHSSPTSTSTNQSLTSITTTSPTPSRPRTKPSKRRRIHLRRRAQDQKISAEKSKLQDELEKEKRARRNREKKVKKKAREKRKKEEVKGVGEVESHLSAAAA